jgi:DNA polymerase
MPSELAPYILATVHPSSILRAPDDQTRHEELSRFIDDLRNVAFATKQSCMTNFGSAGRHPAI